MTFFYLFQEDLGVGERHFKTFIESKTRGEIGLADLFRLDVLGASED